MRDFFFFFFFKSLHGGADLASCEKEAKSFGTLECAVGQTGKEAGLKSLHYGHC